MSDDAGRLPEDVKARALREIMQERGARTSARKAATSQANGRRGGRPLKDLADIPCPCTPEEVAGGHKRSCPRRRAAERRKESKE